MPNDINRDVEHRGAPADAPEARPRLHTAMNAPPAPPVTRLDRQYRACAAIVGLSRRVIADQAEMWGIAPAMKDALVRSVSELATNALGVSSALDLIKIRLEWFPTRVLLSVYDASPQQPKSSAPGLTLEELDALPDDDPLTLPRFGGWGLPLVETLADATGANWLNPAPLSGKWVWARFNAQPPMTEIRQTQNQPWHQ
jgi:Histidine kinase-like ATPase domain